MHASDRKLVNLVAAARLFTIARVLSIDIGYFFDGLEGGEEMKPTPQQRMLLELARNFVAVPSRKHQEAICTLARLLASDEPSDKGPREH